MLIGQLDTDGVAARHYRGPGSAATLIERAISSESATTRADFTPAGGDQFIERDHRAGPDLIHSSADTELCQHAFQQLGVLTQRPFVELGGAGLRLGQHRKLGEREATRLDELEGGLRLALFAGAFLGRSLGRFDLRGLGVERDRRRSRAAWAMPSWRSRRATRAGRSGLTAAGARLGRGCRARARASPSPRTSAARRPMARRPGPPRRRRHRRPAAANDGPGERQVSIAEDAGEAGQQRLAPEAAQTLGERPGRRRRGECQRGGQHQG